MLDVAVFGFLVRCRLRASAGEGAGIALIELSVVEQRYRFVLAVEAGARVGEVAARPWCLGRVFTPGLSGIARKVWSGQLIVLRGPLSSANQSDPVVVGGV